MQPLVKSFRPMGAIKAGTEKPTGTYNHYQHHDDDDDDVRVLVVLAPYLLKVTTM